MTTQINETFSSDLGEFLIDIADSGYAASGGYLVRNSRSAANRTADAIVYSDCSADCTIEAQFTLPNKTSGTAELRLIYRYSDSNNYCFARIVYNGSSVSLNHKTFESGVVTDSAITGLTINSGTLASDVINVKFLVRGNDVIDNYLTNLTMDFGLSNYSHGGSKIQSIGTFNNTETTCGISFTSVESYVASGAPDSSTESFIIDYYKADDNLIFSNGLPELSGTGGPAFGGNATNSMVNNITTGGGPSFGGSSTATQYNPNVSGGPRFGGGGVVQMEYNNTTSGGPRFGGIGVDNVNYTISTSGGITINGVPSHNIVSVYSSVGGLNAGGENSNSATITQIGGASFGGGGVVQMEYSNTTTGGLTANGSNSDYVENSSGGASFGGGGTVQMIYTISKQNDLVNNTFYMGGHTKDMINITMGGYSTLTGISTYNSTGGLIVGGKKFPGDFKTRRKIIIPADTFAETQEFYLGIKFVSGGSCLVYDSSDMLIKHELRSYCVDGGLTHVFFNADVIDPTIDNFWYLYY